MKRVMLAIPVLLLLMTSVAFAHPGHEGTITGAAALRQGFLHPWSGLDHLLAMLAVGLWATLNGRRGMLVLPLLFPVAMLLGALAGRGATLSAPLELFIAASVVAMGMLIALQARWPLRYGVPVVAAIAAAHGYAHGAELPATLGPAGYFAGFTLATALLQGLGMVLGLSIAHALRSARHALPVCGGTIASIGLLLLPW